MRFFFGLTVFDLLISAALPQIGLFLELKTLIAEYPCAGELRESLVDHLYDLVRSTLPENAQAARLLADRHTPAELKGAKLVDGVQHANEELFAKAKVSGSEEIFQAYAEFVEDWCQRTDDRHLVSCTRENSTENDGLIANCGGIAVLWMLFLEGVPYFITTGADPTVQS